MAGHDPRPFIKFGEFVAVTKPKHIGRDLADNPKSYVPLSALQEYWTASKVSSVLRAFPHHLDIDIGIIRRLYLRIFSTLVYTEPGAVRSLPDLFISHNLTDDRLPWSSRPSEWPDAPFFNNFFKQIAGHQWQFFPFRFHPDQLHNRLIRDQCVLPINFVEDIAQGHAASVRAFDIHPEYNHLAPRNEQDRPARHTFVFKIYHNQRHESSYNNERRALLGLSSHPSANVVKSYGSFQQHGSYSLILEYADGGDLGQFFAAEPPPQTVEDVVMFWTSLFQVFAGLERIHQHIWLEEEYMKGVHEDSRPENFLLVKGIHEDIRPENILLMKGPSGSPYEFTPKIADFGLYSRVRTVEGSGMGLDRHGNQRFSSPECCNHTIQRHSGTNMITTLADIFSIGALLSHTVAWVVGGCKEQQRYFTVRKAYHEHEPRLRRFKHSGYEGCFHDSIDPLPVVTKQHEEYIKRLQPSDDVTPKILEWIEQHMLIRGTKDRLRARDILEIFDQFIDSRSVASPPPASTAGTEPTLQSPCWSVPGVSSPSTVDGVSPPAAPPSGAVSELDCRPALQVVVSSRSHDALTPAVGPPQPQPNDSKSTIQPSHDEASSPSPLHLHTGIS